jgi:hypothetical protein
MITATNASPAFTASRDVSEKDREFLAATDPWFRPTNLTSGPDGYLYIVDMYRQHIETPVSIPEDLKVDMSFANGEQYGRIWRVFPKGAGKRPVMLPDLRKATTAELVALLAHPNQWWRLNAQRILVEKQDKSAIADLTKLAAHADPRARLHAIYTLEALNALDENLVKKALGDAHPGVREHAIILAEQYPSLLSEIIRLMDDTAPQVAYQATLSAGQSDKKDVLAALATSAEKHAENASYRLAILSSNIGSSPEIMPLLATKGTFFVGVSTGKLKLTEDYAYVAGARNGKNDIASLLDVLTSPAVSADPQWTVSALTGLTKGIKKSTNKKVPEKSVGKSLQKLENHNSDAVRKQAAEVKKALNI